MSALIWVCMWIMRLYQGMLGMFYNSQAWYRCKKMMIVEANTLTTLLTIQYPKISLMIFECNSICLVLQSLDQVKYYKNYGIAMELIWLFLSISTNNYHFSITLLHTHVFHSIVENKVMFIESFWTQLTIFPYIYIYINVRIF